MYFPIEMRFFHISKSFCIKITISEKPMDTTESSEMVISEHRKVKKKMILPAQAGSIVVEKSSQRFYTLLFAYYEGNDHNCGKKTELYQETCYDGFNRYIFKRFDSSNLIIGSYIDHGDGLEWAPKVDERGTVYYNTNGGVQMNEKYSDEFNFSCSI
jgi:hypothetical protein